LAIELLAKKFEITFVIPDGLDHQASNGVYFETELNIYESGTVISKAVWRSIEEIKAESAKLYPLGIEQIIEREIKK